MKGILTLCIPLVILLSCRNLNSIPYGIYSDGNDLLLLNFDNTYKYSDYNNGIYVDYEYKNAIVSKGKIDKRKDTIFLFNEYSIDNLPIISYYNKDMDSIVFDYSFFIPYQDFGISVLLIYNNNDTVDITYKKKVFIPELNNFRIDIDISNIYKSINKKLRTQVYEKSTFGCDNVFRIDIKRLDFFAFYSNDSIDTLKIINPNKLYWIKNDIYLKRVKVRDYDDIDFEKFVFE